MAGLVLQKAPTSEPVTLAMAKNFLRVSVDDDDDLISMLTSAAREACEIFTNRSFCFTGFMQTMDSFPYYTDTVMSQMAYPPSYYALPMYSTTLWNYSQMIKLWRPPCVSVQGIDITMPDGSENTLIQDTDFLLDTVNEPARIFPMPGIMWPPVLYVPNAVRIRFTAGFSEDGTLVPARVKIAILQLVAAWYENREALTEANMKEMPQHVKMLLWSLRVIDMQPTRG